MLSHQKLKVYGKALYQLALDFVRWFHGLSAGAELASRLSRLIDKSATSVLLNLAEGYGRTARADRDRFLDIAEASAVKAATYLDLWVSKAELPAEQAPPGLELLERVVRIVRVLLPSRSN
ncbi:MAG: four helix bundle protein [Verrucomicrobiia bacterium]